MSKRKVNRLRRGAELRIKIDGGALIVLEHAGGDRAFVRSPVAERTLRLKPGGKPFTRREQPVEVIEVTP